MEIEKEIKKLIKSKEVWNSKDLLKAIKELEDPLCIEFYHIGGYECLRDGNRHDGTCTSLKELQKFLDAEGIEYSKDITDPIELVESIEKAWEDMYDDGGGSGWIEY